VRPSACDSSLICLLCPYVEGVGLLKLPMSFDIIIINFSYRWQTTQYFLCRSCIADLMTATSQLPERFGLIDSSSARWTTFTRQIDKFNVESGGNSIYKVFFLGRHGQGFRELLVTGYYHYSSSYGQSSFSLSDNAGEIKYGTTVRYRSWL
jgi:hypothetical protein